MAQLTGVHQFTLGEAIPVYLNPTAIVFDAPAVCWSPRNWRAEMARIDLDLAHAYRPPEARRRLRAAAAEDDLRRRRRLCAAGPVGLRQDDAAQHRLGPDQALARHGLLRRKPVTACTPQQRNIAQVFQFPVIYDTMTVAENLAFPLRNRGVAPDKIKQRVGVIAEMLEMSGQLNLRAGGLAADAKQKISLGRGLVREDVSAVLFDEPLTVIDPHLKWQLRRKLKQIHHELKLTLIYVTHDQVEALTFADQVVVMTRGRAVQVGSASELFERPQHTFVGNFIGSPGMNIIPCEIDGSGARVDGRLIALDRDYATAGAPRERETGAGHTAGVCSLSGKRRRRLPAGRDHAGRGSGQLQDTHRASGRTSREGEGGRGHACQRGAGWLGFPPEWTRLYADGDVLK